MSDNESEHERRVVRIRRPARAGLSMLVTPNRTTLDTKIVPESMSQHITAIAKPSEAPGEIYAAHFLKMTPLPFQVYFRLSALAKPLNPAFMYLWSDVEMYEWKNQHMRWLFKRLLLFRTPLVEAANETDVGAMVPVSEIADYDKISFYDARGRRQYIMHAQTATNIFRMALEHQDHMFPTPHAPRNPYTNSPFGLGQLATIYTQLNLRYERLPLSLVMFRVSGFDMNRYERHYGAHLRWKAIDGALRDRDLRLEMMCTTLETMYRDTLAPSFSFLIDDFPLMEGETRDVMFELAREYMELSMARVIRNPHHPSIEVILLVFRTEVMKRMVDPHLRQTTNTITSLLTRVRAITAPVRVPPPPPPPQPTEEPTEEPDEEIAPTRRRLHNSLMLLLGLPHEDVSGEIIIPGDPVPAPEDVILVRALPDESDSEDEVLPVRRRSSRSRRRQHA